jgi:hypothetical protein
MLSLLGDSDWKEVFKYGKPHPCDECGSEHQHPGPESIICSTIDCTKFDREDVDSIVAMVNGENDGADWVGVFKLKDGRYASIRAGCDYTGWG